MTFSPVEKNDKELDDGVMDATAAADVTVMFQMPRNGISVSDYFISVADRT